MTPVDTAGATRGLEKCGCGGEPEIMSAFMGALGRQSIRHRYFCQRCKITTKWYGIACEATDAWNLAMSGARPAPDAGIADVARERERQINVEGWAAEHDDKHQAGVLATAGACYALNAIHVYGEDSWAAARRLFPFDEEWFKPKDARRDLVRAAALIIAEIDRLDRALRPAHEDGNG